jgi:hypothetical protein
VEIEPYEDKITENVPSVPGFPVKGADAVI